MIQDIKNLYATNKVFAFIVMSVAVAIAALALFLLALFIRQTKYIVRGTTVDYPATISVQGKGEEVAIPDVASFTFSVIEEKATVADAQKVATDKVNAAIDAVKAAGVDEKDIKTLSYNVYPQYDYNNPNCTQWSCPPSNPVIRGYQVEQSIQVKAKDTTKVGDILTTLGTLGVQNLSGIQFTLDDEDAIKAASREKAIEDAQAKAEELADKLGVSLGRLSGYYEETPYYPYADQSYGYGGEMARSAVAPQLPMGENSYTTTVNLTYEIR